MVLLSEYVDKKVQIMTNDSRIVRGILLGFDQKINLVLEQSEERIFSHDGVELAELGVYLIRGDNIAVVGLVDEEADAEINLENIKCDPPKPITH